jgi:hypothetical protein
MSPIQVLVLASYHFSGGHTSEALSKLILASILGFGFGMLAIYVSNKLSSSDRDRDSFDASDAIIGGIKLKKANRKLSLWELGSVSNTLTVESINLIKTEEKIKQGSLNFLSLWESTQQLNSLAQDFEALSQKVDKLWIKLSQDERDELKEIAYELAEKDCDEGDTTKTRLGRLLNGFIKEPVKFVTTLNQAISLAKKDLKRLNKVSSEHDAARKRLEEARYQFVDNILNAIEQTDSQHRQFLSDTLEELKRKTSTSGD